MAEVYMGDEIIEVVGKEGDYEQEYFANGKKSC